ncbi:MAG TPA: outer membrane beta-barrel protein [Thermoanaerobaculia bacterium]|jgi:opacity protein-like surface antigen|nr:outer membrane beta-barrel protein [Thermoanaerobaculia bacterium]
MKRTILCAAAALAILAAPAAKATDFSVFGAYWDTQDADQGLGGGAKLRLGQYVELRGTYFSDVTADTDPERFDFEVSAIPLEAGLRFDFAPNEAFSPYIGGGASYVMLDTTEGDIDDEVGWYAVLGAEFARQPSGLGFMVEGIYRGVEATVTEDDDGFPDHVHDDVNLNLDGFGVNAGLVWHF